MAIDQRFAQIHRASDKVIPRWNERRETRLEPAGEEGCATQRRHPRPQVPGRSHSAAKFN